LILADWLEEHGTDADRARAEFIRLQLARAKLTDDDPQYEVSLSRERELLRTHAETWLGPVANLLEPARRQEVYNYRCGLIHLEATPSVLAKPTICDSGSWGWVSSLETTEPAGEILPNLAPSPLLAGLSDLTVGRWVDESGLAALLKSPHLARLRSLSLGHQN